ncbi:hypothetical protein [Sphingopyxis panaciterrae]
MTGITSLELAALGAVRTESAEWADIVDQVLLGGSVLSRINTGGGFFTELKAGAGGNGQALEDRSSHNDAWINVEGLDHGLGIVLHLKDGMVLLEGYAVGPEDTSKVDFEHGRFMVAGQPGPLSSNDR